MNINLNTGTVDTLRLIPSAISGRKQTASAVCNGNLSRYIHIPLENVHAPHDPWPVLMKNVSGIRDPNRNQENRYQGAIHPITMTETNIRFRLVGMNTRTTKNNRAPSARVSTSSPMVTASRYHLSTRTKYTKATNKVTKRILESDSGDQKWVH